MHLGIDFGTTRSVVALADRGNYPVITFTAHDGTSYDFYPSVCAERQGELRFGFDALAVEHESGWDLHRSFKRLLHGAEGGFERSVQFGQTRLLVVEVITRFLTQLGRDLGARSSLPVNVHVNDLACVLAVPANAHSAARLITLEAFRRAGFNVLGMLNEPSAAGIEYAHRYRSTITSRRENVLVYDLGGGTFDSTLVVMSDKQHDVLKSRGIVRLGGDDFDQVLLTLALRRQGVDAERLEPRLKQKLLSYCRDQKERIHPNTRRILLDFADSVTPEEAAAHGIDRERIRSIPSEDFELACLPLVERTLEVLDQLLLEWARDSGREPLSDLAGIYMVGGGSALPLVGRRLREVYGRRIHRSNYAASAIAIGLAIALDEGAGYQVKERFSRQFGVFRESMCGERVEFDVIFSDATELPTDASVVEVRRSYAPTHNVGHYRYVECGWLDAAGAPSGDITRFSEVIFPFDPELRQSDRLNGYQVRRADQPFCEVEELYKVDRHGVVELTIRDLTHGYERTERLTETRAP